MPDFSTSCFGPDLSRADWSRVYRSNKKRVLKFDPVGGCPPVAACGSATRLLSLLSSPLRYGAPQLERPTALNEFLLLRFLMPATSAAGVSSVRYRTTPRRFGHLRPTKHHSGAHSSNFIKTQLEKRLRSPITRAAGDGSIEPLDAVVFTLIVDDLIFPDGKTKMGVLGRGRSHPRSSLFASRSNSTHRGYAFVWNKKMTTFFKKKDNSFF